MADAPVIEAEGLVLDLPNLAARQPFRRAPLTRILDGIDLRLFAGRSLGIVGESGSGKTSLGRTLTRLYEPTSGRIAFEGQAVTHAKAHELRPLRARMQMIFQDPQSSLNPRHRIGRILSQPLAAFGRISGRAQGVKEAERLLERVGLPTEFARRYPHELSGGQRQRVGIARAIALAPALVVADEIVSGLDVSSQAQILALLRDLKRDLGLALIFISHDLSVVRILCDEIMVLRQGEVAEAGPTDRIFAAPQSPYTRTLLGAIPLPDIDPGWIERESEDVR